MKRHFYTTFVYVHTTSILIVCVCVWLYVSAARSKSMVMGEVSRGPCRPASPSLQEGALKAGWLKKQRSIMKNWQLRWFVLRSDQLYFYKDEEETKPQVGGAGAGVWALTCFSLAWLWWRTLNCVRCARPPDWDLPKYLSLYIYHSLLTLLPTYLKSLLHCCLIQETTNVH